MIFNIKTNQSRSQNKRADFSALLYYLKYLLISKHAKDFGGSLTDIDVIKLCGCSRQSYYKYKAEIKRADSI
jgi:hypothetical protein